jgi:hypothetical protein
MVPPDAQIVRAQIEFVYNNGGYIAQTQNEQYFNVWDDIEPADTLQTFQKVPGQRIQCFQQPSCKPGAVLLLALDAVHADVRCRCCTSLLAHVL